jgi:UDP:flavonoid glycosyltransferase YjiC (YdhE family)
MAKILFAVFPVTGHVNPGLPIARELVRRGHDVRWYTTPRFRAAAEAAGARVVPYCRAAEIDETRFDRFDGRPEGGIRQLQWDVENIFIGIVPGQYADLEEELRREPADVIVGDNASIVCSVVSEKLGIPFVCFGVTAMGLSSRDTAPFGMALLPSYTPLGRLRNRLLHRLSDGVIFRGARAAYNRIRAELGLPPYTRGTFDFPKDAALYLQGSAASFEYPRSDMPANVRWIGASVPEPPAGWTPPAWWPELDRWPAILVTQGTINNDYDQVVAAGKTEEKPEVANRVARSGAGIGMNVLVPTEQQLRDAVTKVLRGRTYAARAEEIAQEMAGLDAPAEAAAWIETLTGRAVAAA